MSQAYLSVNPISTLKKTQTNPCYFHLFNNMSNSMAPKCQHKKRIKSSKIIKLLSIYCKITKINHNQRRSRTMKKSKETIKMLLILTQHLTAIKPISKNNQTLTNFNHKTRPIKSTNVNIVPFITLMREAQEAIRVRHTLAKVPSINSNLTKEKTESLKGEPYARQKSSITNCIAGRLH